MPVRTVTMLIGYIGLSERSDHIQHEEWDVSWRQVWTNTKEEQQNAFCGDNRQKVSVQKHEALV